MSADDAVRDALERLYPPADNANVFAQVQARSAAGETGTTPPGGGGLSGWLPWIAGALVVGLLAGGAGAIGLFGQTQVVAVSASAVGALARTATAFDCPAGAPVTEVGAQQRVLVLATSDDGAYLAVRDPADYGRQVWLPADSVTLDDGQAPLTSLPVRGCPEPTIEAAPPVVTPSPTPSSPGQPEQPGDTTAPSISAGTVSPQPLFGLESAGFCPTTSTVVVTASDDTAISSVTASWSMAGGTATLQGVSGSSYTFALSVPYTGFADTTATVTFTASDAAGNTSSSSTTFGVRATCLN